MRIGISVFVACIMTGPLIAQEEPRHWPHLTFGAGQGGGSFVNRFSDSGQPRHVAVKTLRLWSADVRSSRFFVDSQLTQWSGNHAVKAFSIDGRATVVRIGLLRPGIGIWHTQSADTYDLLRGDNWTLATHGQHQMTAGLLDIGFGAYDRSHIRMAIIQGSTKVTDSLGLNVQGRPTDSPAAYQVQDRSRFRAIQVGGAIRRWGFSLTGSATGITPQNPSYAIPGHGLGILTSTVSYVSPFHIGVSATATRLIGQSAAGTQSVQPFYDSWNIGVFARVP